MTNLFHHFAHLKFKPVVKLGEVVDRGDLIGYVGNSGTVYSHLHYEIFNGKPPTWNYYPVGKSKDYVAAQYTNPSSYIGSSIPAPNTSPNAGYGFLDYVKDQNVFHPGIDINSGSGNQDNGVPVYASVHGRVAYISPVIVKGWGWHIWIEDLTINQKEMIRRIRYQGTEYIDWNGAESWGIADPNFAKFLDNCGIPIIDVDVLPNNTHTISLPRWTVERK